ncbi:acetyltransferase (GNAT) family protein [Kribbella voronezhensis]|uniref:Acetyltransferase (GNAT) family protein n=1 Tax=Kribbella voronezhensis TaxID=2512212 RepID=A0A4R7T5X1_9ACTN|nr:GNAT family N-acetyltransferase [Kribbella voronezhensis]TDU87271.1 acetyltransferase (GNAT) family protein [Kribbella voronezhensis]
MLGELARRWQAGRQLSRGWSDVSEDHGVIVLRIGDPERMVSYLAADEDLPYAAQLARDDEYPAGLSWLSVVTTETSRVLPRIQAEGLDYRRTEWLMTVALDRQSVRRAPAPYAVEVELCGDWVVAAEVRAGDVVAASGQLVVIGKDAVADLIWTEPEHRRQGLAGAMMSALVEEARRAGATTGLLAASREGRALYSRLGWETFAEILVARTGVR